MVNIPQYDTNIDEQVEIDAHYSVISKGRVHDIDAFKKDEAISIPKTLIMIHLVVYLMKIKSKLNKCSTLNIRPSFEDRWCYTSSSNYTLRHL